MADQNRKPGIEAGSVNRFQYDCLRNIREVEKMLKELQEKLNLLKLRFAEMRASL